MPCFHPVLMYRNPCPSSRGSNGKRPTSHNPKYHDEWEHFHRPCGYCSGCRMRKASEWATRCLHEASLYSRNSFITLTYDADNLPDDWSLSKKAFPSFLKRLKSAVAYRYLKALPRGSSRDVRAAARAKGRAEAAGIRVYYCGEYGEQFGRPHYHAIIFNFDFDDKYFWRRTPQGHVVWRSDFLEASWTLGNSEIGSVTYESACYVARYIHKKHYGDSAIDHYTFVVPTTGEVVCRTPEFAQSSRRPGIGYSWFKKNFGDVYPHDEVIVKGKKMKPPKYYDSQFEMIDPLLYEGVQYNRLMKAKLHADNNTPARLAVREKVHLAKMKRLKRSLQ